MARWRSGNSPCIALAAVALVCLVLHFADDVLSDSIANLQMKVLLGHASGAAAQFAGLPNAASTPAQLRQLKEAEVVSSGWDAINGWLLVSMAGSVPIAKVEAASQLALIEALNVSQEEAPGASVLCKGSLVVSTTTTTNIFGHDPRRIMGKRSTATATPLVTKTTSTQMFLESWRSTDAPAAHVANGLQMSTTDSTGTTSSTSAPMGLGSRWKFMEGRMATSTTSTSSSTTTVVAASTASFLDQTAQHYVAWERLLAGHASTPLTTSKTTLTSSTSTTMSKTGTTVYYEYARMLNVSCVVKVRSSRSAVVEQLAMEISRDFSGLNATLWEFLFTPGGGGIDIDLSDYYELTAFVAYPARVVPLIPPVVEERKQPMAGEYLVAFFLFISWPVLLFLTRRALKLEKMVNWTHIAVSTRQMNFINQVKSFESFCRHSGQSQRSFTQRKAAKTRHHEKPLSLKKRLMRMYGPIILRAYEGVMVTGWRFVLGFGLLSITITCGIRGARLSKNAETGERVYKDATLDANMAGCSKILEVLLPLTCFMVGLFVFSRLKRLNDLLASAGACQQHIQDLALICCNALPHQFMEDVAKAKWLLYRYLMVFMLFTYADASPHLKAVVHDEMISSEAFSKSGLLSVNEEEELAKSEERSSLVLLWISHLLMEIGRACEADRPCVQQLMKTLMKLRSSSAQLAKEMARATPISFLQMLYLLVDFTVILTPIGISNICGADHEGYSMYFMSLVTTVTASCAFHGSLRLISEAADPFGSNLGVEHGTNATLVDVECRLFALLGVRRQAMQAPLPRMQDDLEPIWAGKGLGWDFLTMPTPQPEELPVALPSQSRPQRDQLIPGLDSIIPREGVDDDFMSLEDDDSLALSDVDRSDAAEIMRELRNKPPVFNPEGRGGIERNLQLMEITERERTKAKLISSEAEASNLRQTLDQVEQVLRDMQANSVPAKDAEQVIQLLAEWIAPPRPVRLSDVTLARLAEISRKQSLRVKKILSLSAGKVKSKTLQGINKPHGIQAAEVGAAKAAADYKRLIEDLMERLDEENQVSLRLKTQLTDASHVSSHLGRLQSTPALPEEVEIPLPIQAEDAPTESAKKKANLQSRGVTKDGKLK